MISFKRTESLRDMWDNRCRHKKNDQSQRNTCTRIQIQNNHSLEEGTPQNNISSIQASNQPSTTKMDQINWIHMEFIFKKRGHSPETDRL